MVSPTLPPRTRRFKWVSIPVDMADIKPETITTGFNRQYGIEVAFVTGKGGDTVGLANKLPPFGQPVSFANFDPSDSGVIVEPITGTKFNYKTGKVKGDWCPSPLGRIILGRLTNPDSAVKIPIRKSGGGFQAQVNVNAKLQFEADYWRGVLDAQGKVDGGYY